MSYRHCVFALGVLAAIAPLPAAAQDDSGPRGWIAGNWSLTVGASGFMAPRFQGADTLAFNAVPMISLGRAGKTQRFSSRNESDPEGLQFVMVPADTASLIGIKIILDGLARPRNPVTAIAMAIGRTVEHEAQVLTWQHLDRGGFRAAQKAMDNQGVTSHHRGVSNVFRFNKALASGTFTEQHWEPWSRDAQLRIGIAIMDAVVRSTGWFAFGDDPTHHHKRGKASSPAKVLLPKADLLRWIDAGIAADELNSPIFQPTVVPPRRWEGSRRGGYWTPYVMSPRLVRFKASQDDQKQSAADEYDAIDMPKVYSALHALQETPWRVNKRVLAVARALDNEGRRAAGLPIMPDVAEEVGPAPADADTNPEALREWKRRKTRAFAKAYEELTKYRAMKRTLRVAMSYEQYDRFYFPHMLDFRGRFYPIPIGLQPQGDALAKGLLEFASGRPITEENDGANWLAVHLASTWGHDKWDFARRIDWVHDNEAMIRAIAADPLANREWAVADKPWTALAAVFEWVSFLDHGFGFVSHLPVTVDGTCNGIQHLAALTRDAVTGAMVNLTPASAPSDIYADVAGELQEDLERLARAPGVHKVEAQYWLNLCSSREIDFEAVEEDRNPNPSIIPRSLTKRQVMVLPYGGTKESFFSYTKEWLDKHDKPPSTDGLSSEQSKALWVQRTNRISLASSLLWDIVHRKVKGGMAVMEWLRKCAKHSAVSDQPIFWVTPSGFVVRHFYGRQKERDVAVMLRGERVWLNVNETTKDLDVTSQLRGVPPNFIHSLDAAALVLTINGCTEQGITGLTSVHDAYGTHAADMWDLFRIIREAFVEVHNVDSLGQFRAACQAVISSVLVNGGMDPQEAFEKADEQLGPSLDMGDLDITDVMRSDYFFS